MGLEPKQNFLLGIPQESGDTGIAAHHNYDLSKVHALLFDVFSEDDLRDYCQQEPLFSPVYKELKDIDRPREIIRRMVDHAERKGLVAQLLAWAKKTNPNRYAQGEPYETK